MAIWCCPTCGHEKDARCKPKKCPDCDKPVEFAKKGEEVLSAATCACTTKAAKKK
jgi:ABC-type ATPase with predicted acetyltransferase domain